MKLKPCPFCGAIEWEEYHHCWILLHKENCFFSNDRPTILPKDIKARMIKKWNRRAK
jgi:hypothetical protein